MIRLNLQRFAKTKNTSSSSSSNSSQSSTSSNSASTSNTSSKTKDTSKSTQTGTSHAVTNGSSTANTTGWQNGTSTTTNTTVKSEDTLAAEQGWKDNSSYVASQKVNDAYAAKQDAEKQYNDYGEYNSKYADTINGLLDKILNREDFSYDFKADPLYQQYRDQYQSEGQEAMLNTQAASTALTGGYGSSYATTAGSQAYQQSLRQADDKIPELYQLAMDKYNMDTQKLNDQFSTVGNQEDREYGQYTQGKQDLLNAMNYYQGDYSTESSNDLSRWGTELGNAADLAQYLYNQDYSTTTETTSQNGSTTTENSKNTTDTKSKDTTKSTGTSQTNSNTSSNTSSNSSTASSSSSSSNSSSTSQNTLLRDIDEDEVNAVKNYVDAGDATKASHYIMSMAESGKYSDKQLQAMIEMAGITDSEAKEIKNKNKK